MQALEEQWVSLNSLAQATKDNALALNYTLAGQNMYELIPLDGGTIRAKGRLLEKATQQGSQEPLYILLTKCTKLQVHQPIPCLPASCS